MLSDYRLVSCGVDGLIFLWDGREKEADQAVDDWIEKRKAPPVENDSDDEFIPEILRNYMHDGPAVLR